MLPAAFDPIDEHRPAGSGRERLPNLRPGAAAFKFRIGEGEGFVHVGEYADGRPGEIFLRMAKLGSTLAGLTEALGVAASIGLQHGVPLQTLVSQFVSLRFDPSGHTDDVEIPVATSILDYVFRRLALDYLDGSDQRASGAGVSSVRERLPRRRPAVRALKFTVGDGKGFAHVGQYADGRPGELFIRMAKQGSTMRGLTEALGIAVSTGLQHGVPLTTFVRQFINLRFEPAGVTDDPEIRLATSILDYLFRRLAVDYLSFAERAELGVFTVAERHA